jgi:DNA-binding SARP family transcriptional activator
LAVDRDTARWLPTADAWLDVDALRSHLAACATHGHPSDEICPDCISLLAKAVELYQDGFLAGFTLPDSPAFDEWQFFEGESLRNELADALQQLADWHGARNEYDVAIPYARRWVVLDPLHEPAQRALMALYAHAGQRAAALRQYAECERVLAEELGIAPDAETTQLYQAIRERRALPEAEPVSRTTTDDGRRMTGRQITCLCN